MIKKNITGIVLAGGKSSRMGSDKGMIMLNGKKFIQHILKALSPNVDEIIIIANNTNYDDLGYKVYIDLIKERGPLAGIYTGLTESKTEKNLIVSCDIPFITSDLIKHIIDNSDSAEITVPVFNGNIEPLCGVYSKSITDKIYSLLLKDELKMHNVLNYFTTNKIEILNGEKLYAKNLLVNINTPAELAEYKKTEV